LLRRINTHSYDGEDAAVNDVSSSCPLSCPEIILAVISQDLFMCKVSTHHSYTKEKYTMTLIQDLAVAGDGTRPLGGIRDR
jgi:hypothetical protein